MEKRIASIKKSTLLKDYIKSNVCGFISEDLLREDPAEAFQSASELTRCPFLYNVKLKLL